MKSIKKWAAYLWYAAVGIAVVAPVFLYRHQFGTHLSSNHTKWAEMGAAMSGIYGPIIGFLTLLILYQQHKTQKHQQSRQDELHLQSLSRDNLDRTMNAIKAMLGRGEVVEILQVYAALSEQELIREYESGTSSRAETRQLVMLWLSAYNSFSAFNTPEDPLSHWFYGAMREKIMVELGMPACMVLDRIALLQKTPINHFEYDSYLNDLRTRLIAH